MPGEVVIFAPLGPNPAPFVELVWALHEERGLRARAAFVVLTERGERYFSGEVLGPGEMLDQLTELIPTTLSREDVRLVVAERDGHAIEDDAHGDDSRAYQAAVWRAARAAVLEAGDDPVIFGLAAGRRRTMTAMQVAVFQLLARPQDRAIDVRVSDPRAEGGSGFYFPEQRAPIALGRGEWLDPRSVEVQLVDVALPRLGALLEPSALESYEGALAAGQAAIDVASPPELSIDLSRGVARLDGVALKLSRSMFVWFAALALARKEPVEDPAGWIEVSHSSLLARLAPSIEHAPWRAALAPSIAVALELPSLEEVGGEDELAALRTLRSRLRARLREQTGANARFVVPEGDERDGNNRERLALSPDRIRFVPVTLPAPSKPKRGAKTKA